MFKVLGAANAEGFFQSFETLDDDTARRELRESFATTEQHIFNAMHKQCSVCRGFGYRIYRKGGRVVRESVGCQNCLGLGVVPHAE